MGRPGSHHAPEKDSALCAGITGSREGVPVKVFDFLGITLQYELCYTNVLQLLDLAGIPLHAKERLDAPLGSMPIVIGGGPCAYNPEPIADFFDLFYIGEGETVYDELLDLYKACRKAGTSRREFLYRAQGRSRASMRLHSTHRSTMMTERWLHFPRILLIRAFRAASGSRLWRTWMRRRILTNRLSLT